MAQTWFVRIGAKQHGPYSSAQLVELARKSVLSPNCEVRRGDLPNWTKASRIKGLFEGLRAERRPDSLATPISKHELEASSKPLRSDSSSPHEAERVVPIAAAMNLSQHNAPSPSVAPVTNNQTPNQTSDIRGTSLGPRAETSAALPKTANQRVMSGLGYAVVVLVLIVRFVYDGPDKTPKLSQSAKSNSASSPVAVRQNEIQNRSSSYTADSPASFLSAFAPEVVEEWSSNKFLQSHLNAITVVDKATPDGARDVLLMDAAGTYHAIFFRDKLILYESKIAMPDRAAAEAEVRHPFRVLGVPPSGKGPETELDVIERNVWMVGTYMVCTVLRQSGNTCVAQRTTFNMFKAMAAGGL